MGQKVHPLGFRLGITQEHKGQWFEEMKTYPNSVYQDFVLRNCLLNSFKNADITSIDIERSFNQVIVKVTAARSRLLTGNIKQTTNYLNALLKLMVKNPLTSATALANTNITDGSFITLNKWNNKIAHYEHLLRRSEAGSVLYSTNKEKNIGPPDASTEGNTTQPKVDLQNENLLSIQSNDKTLASQSEMGVDSLQSDRSKDLEQDKDPTGEELSSYEPRLTLLIGSSSQESISNSAFLTAKTIQEQLEKRVPFRRAVKVALRRGTTPKGIKIQISGRLNGAEIARSEWIRQGRVPLHTLRAQVDYCSHQAKTQYGILGIKVWIFQGYKE